jgi:hypothetical protein
MGALPRGGLGCNDDTVERASTRKAPGNGEGVGARFVEGWGFVGYLSLGFDQRRQGIEPESLLNSGRTEIDVLEVNDARIV